jgi:3-oxoacyl-[acyl-carrier-protein] synthase II
MTSRRVVVTGLGIVSPAGFTWRDSWRNVTAAQSFVRPIDRFDVTTFPTRIAAAVDESQFREDLGDFDRITRFAIAAAESAADDARLGAATPRASSRRAALIASGMGTYAHAEVFPAAAAASAHDEFDWPTFHTLVRKTAEARPAERRTPGTVSAHIARRLGFRGASMSVMTACAAGTQAIGDAARWIRDDRADVVVAGGADSELYPMGLASFCLLRALSRRNDEPERASRPFAAGRDGFVIGEGAGALVLEELTHALNRGATIYAELTGFGSASDAYRVTDPHPTGDGAVRAMTAAIRQAGISADAVGYINAHGTSTVANDRIETAAMKRVFGVHAPKIPISSTKSLIGHLTVAAGAVEALMTILSISHQTIHPTLNAAEGDPECDLDYVAEGARPAVLEHALSNSFAFGGQCASVLFSRFHAEGAA